MAPVAEANVGHMETGSAAGQLAHEGHIDDVEEHDGGDRCRDGEERSRQPSHETTGEDDQGQRAQPERQRTGLDLAVGDALHESVDTLHDPVGVRREAAQLGQLRHENGEGDAVEVAVAHRLGEQLGEEPEPGDGSDEHQTTSEDGEHGGQIGSPIRACQGERNDRGRDDRRQR